MRQHKRPDGITCSYAGKPGKACLHCGTLVPDGTEVPVLAEPQAQPDPPEVAKEAKEAAEKAARDLDATRFEVMKLARKYLTLENYLECLALLGGKIGRIQIDGQETLRIVTLPDRVPGDR